MFILPIPLANFGCTAKSGKHWNLGTNSKKSSTEICLSNRILMMGKWYHAQKKLELSKF